jgi:DNA-binding XRE family transcriptional regulator
MRISNELQKGKAGEYLVCADLILKGFVAFISEQGLPYDVVLDTGKRLLKIQVKTSLGTRKVPQRSMDSQMYIFNIKRHGKNNQKRYADGEVDAFALVCLSTRKIGYLTNADMPETINIRADELKGSYYDEKGFADYQKAMLLTQGGMNQSQAAREIGISPATVNRMCAKGFKPFLTNARYFSDFIREPEWFYGI